MAPRVLLIDDSEMTIALLQSSLQKLGIIADCATDLAGIDVHLGQHAYQLIVVDVNMPEMYGDDVVEFLRVQKHIQAKLILYSDAPESELLVRAQRVGAHGTISKAHGLEASVQAIEAALAAQRSTDEPGQATSSSDAPEPKKAPAMLVRKVLVVDDSEAIGTLLKAELSARGHEVTTALSADLATKIILKKKTRPDLVLLDVNMPGISGEEFCRFVKGNAIFESIRVIFCSGENETRLQELVKSCGADGYVRKDALIAQEILDLLGE
jgi:CheY-like chemotaxis protein